MDQIIPWKTLMKPIRQHYPKAGNGRLPVGLEIMLRIYFMQQWYGLSDPAIVSSMLDRAACLAELTVLGTLWQQE